MNDKNYLEEEINMFINKENKINKLDEISLRKELREEARKMTLEKLPEFIDKIMSYEHDYGKICVAIGAAAAATAWSIQNSPKGQITGFQASCVMWEFILGWNRNLEDKTIRLLQVDDMLYPQYNFKFTTITTEDFKKLQKEAYELLEEGRGAENVRSHWQSIVDGVVPFGYKIKD